MDVLDLKEKDIASFLAESNAIESYVFPPKWYVHCLKGAVPVNEHVFNSCVAFGYVLAEHREPLTENHIKTIQKLVTMGFLDDKHCGHYRTEVVMVGSHIAPGEFMITSMMADFITQFNNQDGNYLSRHAHFEFIHPFIDGNGRTGRLLWLWDRLRCEEDLEDFLSQFDGKNFREKQIQYYDYLGGQDSVKR